MVSLFLGIQIDWTGIGASILQVLRTFCGYVAGYIYDFIAVLYNLFMLISRAEILNSAFVNEIYRKVGLILGIFMVFKLSFSAIQALVDPNKFNDKKTGFTSVIVRCVISIVLLGVTPAIFKEAFALQSLLIGANNSSDNIIYKLIIGQNVGNVENFGTTLAGELFFSFYTDDVDPRLKVEGEYHESQEVLWKDVDYTLLKDSFVDPSSNETPGSFTSTVEYLSAVDLTGEYCIEFNIIFSILFGVITAWMLAMYCIQAGIRVVQLAYLQLIAPVPIFSYISDPDGAFKKWIQQCVTTYLDLFIRLAIIYFVLFLAKNIMLQLDPDNANSLLMTSTGLSPNSPYLVWVKVFLILGLLLFAKKVPELLKDLFPNLGGGAASLSMGLKSPKKLLNDIPIVGGAANKVLGFSGNLAKKGASFAWRHTGGSAVNKVKNNYNRWKDDRKGYKEQQDKDRESNKIWNKYGNDFENGNFEEAFADGRDKNGELAASYKALTEAKKKMKEVIEAGYTRDSREYMQAEKAVSDAQKNHDINRDKYRDLARREDNLKRYQSRHPKPTAPSPAPSVSPVSNPQPSREPLPNGNTITPAGIEVVESSRPQQPSRTERERQSSGTSPQDEHAQLVERYNKATDPAEREKIRKEIDDFERKH